MAVYPRDARVVVYDALGEQNGDVARHLARATFDFFAQDLSTDLAPLIGWQYNSMVPGVDIPPQNDGCHCGVFAVVFAYCLVRSHAHPPSCPAL